MRAPMSLSACHPSAQLMMRPTEIVGTADQPHARFESRKATTRVARATGQTGETLSHRPIEALNKRRIELDASRRESQEFLCPLNGALGHTSNDLDHPMFRCFLDDCANHDLWPFLQAAASAFACWFDFLAERPPDTVGVGRPPIG